jgi:hypothetical protein
VKLLSKYLVEALYTNDCPFIHLNLGLLPANFSFSCRANQEDDPSETYLCREPGLWGEHSLTSDAIAEKTSMLLHKLFLQNPALLHLKIG